jgi:hypothetical protein
MNQEESREEPRFFKLYPVTSEFEQNEVYLWYDLFC